jgi:hypothetical protein
MPSNALLIDCMSIQYDVSSCLHVGTPSSVSFAPLFGPRCFPVLGQEVQVALAFTPGINPVDIPCPNFSVVSDYDPEKLSGTKFERNAAYIRFKGMSHPTALPACQSCGRRSCASQRAVPMRAD